MNREDIIRMAQEAGWTGPEENVTYVAMLERFANLVAAEREACANLVDYCDPRATKKGIAAAIRTRGKS